MSAIKKIRKNMKKNEYVAFADAWRSERRRQLSPDSAVPDDQRIGRRPTFSMWRDAVVRAAKLAEQEALKKAQAEEAEIDTSWSDVEGPPVDLPKL